MATPEISGYRFEDAECGCAHDYLLPAISRTLNGLELPSRRAFDLGCGNGAVANWLSQRGFEVAGVDPSEEGIAAAKRAYPSIDLRLGSAYDPLHQQFGKFPLVVSLEVVEHVYAPRAYARCLSELLLDDGYALISTPYHGYWKNLALAICGQMDRHYSALWDHGHIKFWSANTITLLLAEVGLEVCQILRVGRIPQLAKSMLVVAKKGTCR